MQKVACISFRVINGFIVIISVWLN